jgi:riboflavin kinase/FMN adenylyltransferase
MVLFPDDTNLKLLSTQSEKIELLEKAGVDHLIVFPFTKAFSRLTALEYVRDILVNQLHIHRLVIGYDHQFGRNREGSITQLREMAPLFHFEVEEIEARMIDDVNISSTKIRQSLKEGDTKTAAKYLGYQYGFSGLVVQGKQIGRTIGYPTANLQLSDRHKLIPGDGVYAVKAYYKGKVFGGMMNIGNKPTVNALHPEEKSVEVHLFDFNENLYNEVIRIECIEKLRDEQKFAGLEALKAQLHSDKMNAQKLLA